MPSDLRRVRYVTANFHLLQGLVLVPAWLLFLWGISLGQWPALDPGTLLGRGGVVVAFVLAAVSAYQWYKRRFGQIELLESKRRTLVILLGLGLLFVGRFLTVAAGGALCMLVWIYGVHTGDGLRLRPYWAVVLTVAAFHPLLGWSGPPEILLKAALICALIICSLLDHWLLVRTLPPLAEEADEPAL